MDEYIKKSDALAFPFANGQYDHENADEHFINKQSIGMGTQKKT